MPRSDIWSRAAVSAAAVAKDLRRIVTLLEADPETDAEDLDLARAMVVKTEALVPELAKRYIDEAFLTPAARA